MLRMKYLVAGMCLGLCFLASANLFAQEKEEKKEKAKKPATETVAQEPFQVEVELDGVFEATKTFPVSLSPEEFRTLKVVEAVSHGAQVKEGQTLIRFETEDLDDQIEKLKASRALAELQLQRTREEAAYLQQTVPLRLANVQREQEEAESDLKFYLEIMAPLSERSAKESLKMAEFQVEYSKEELDQLKKMYEADDLTEETEEIILRRAKRQYEYAKFNFERTKTQSERSLEVDLPRQREQRVEQNRLSSIERAKELLQLPISLEEVQLRLEKMEADFEESGKKLKGLQADRKLLVVKSPAEGYIYYGEPTRGSWPNQSAIQQIQKKLRPQGSVTPDEVVMTVVQLRPLMVRASLEEKHRMEVKRGTKGHATPEALPDAEYPVTVTEISLIPLFDKKFDCKLEVSLKEAPEWLVPGMNCKLSLTTYQNGEALVVPKAVVFGQDDEEEAPYVFVYEEGKPAQRQTVELGKSNDKQLEILSGVSAGDLLLKEEPKEEDSAEEEK
ncbi:HlyD family efflux transporter periplasmic adaptor subunit [Planctomycetales bacterium 10988]|nr:HlyD family efflux transporter periplasmic adaptor subunit [Planctomycetales bacterium 10988]